MTLSIVLSLVNAMHPTRFSHQIPTHLYPLKQSKHILTWFNYLLFIPLLRLLLYSCCLHATL